MLKAMYNKYLVVIVAIVLVTPHTLLAEGQGIKVVTTFHYLADDIKQLLCNGDEVYSLVPVGVDPHEYSLTPKDVELLRDSDLVVSTSHTHLEAKVYELKIVGELRSPLIEIPKIPNMSFRYVPGTNSVNYHALTYDPDNYIVLMKTVSNELVKLRPECSSTYLEKVNTVIRHVEDVRKNSKITNLAAIGASPLVQYAVEWLGVKIITYVVVDPEASPTPNDINDVEKLLSTKSVDLVIVTDEGLSHERILADLAIKYSVPILTIPSPTTPGSTILKLQTVLNNFNKLSSSMTYASEENQYQEVVIATLITTAIILIVALRRVKSWR